MVGAVLVLAGIAGAIGVAQWWVTRPTKTQPIDTSRARADIEAKYGKSNVDVQGHGLP